MAHAEPDPTYCGSEIDQPEHRLRRRCQPARPAVCPDLDPRIRDHYLSGNERDRLAAGAGRLEFLRTQDLLTRLLPPPPAVVLDVGGAAGAHAVPLAAQGHEVHLIDPVPLHIEQARAVPGLASVTLGDARALRWPDATVDAVLLLGPLYHLTERADRGDVPAGSPPPSFTGLTSCCPRPLMPGSTTSVSWPWRAQPGCCLI